MKLTAEEIKVLVEANNIYLFDWLENDEDEKSAGWRHPVYFIELRKPFDYSRLVDAGLMEKHTFSFYETYRITELGMNAIKELEAPAAPDAGSGAADRDALLRGDLYNRVQEVLDLALFYLPGELGEFPDKVQQTVADFKNYRNLAEKQIQERDAQLAAAQEREALSPLGLLAQAVSSSVSWDSVRNVLYIQMGNTEYGFGTEMPIDNPTAKAIWALWQYTRQWEQVAQNTASDSP